MSDDTTVEAEIAEPDEEVEAVDEVEETLEVDPNEGLKKALAAERKARKEADRKSKTLEQQLADKDKPAEDLALDQARREAREEALAESNGRYVRSEVKAALTGKVTNPALALRLIDTSGIEVDANGDIDSDAVDAAIADLLAEAPELAVNVKRFQGGADQGAKGKQSKTAQMTQAEFDQIKGDYRAVKKAKDEGLLNAILGIKS
jgi:hypothetical protein